jgi:hypothetical protein
MLSNINELVANIATNSENYIDIYINVVIMEIVLAITAKLVSQKTEVTCTI